MNKFTRKYTNGIYVKLGYACNAACIYCSQAGHEKEQLILNEDIVEYIAVHSAVPRKCASDKYIIMFYGGEPLLYWNLIKEITEDLFSNPDFVVDNVDMTCITNGILLDEEKAVFFNRYNIRCRLSYDGPDESARPIRMGELQRRAFMQIKRKDIYFVWSTVNNSIIRTKIYLEKIFPGVESEFVMCRYVSGIPEMKRFVITSESVVKRNFEEIASYYAHHKADYLLARMLNGKLFKHNNIEIIDIAGNRHHSCDYISMCGTIYNEHKISVNEKSKAINGRCISCRYFDMCNGSRRSNMVNGNIYECQIQQYINMLYLKYNNIFFAYLDKGGYAVINENGYRKIEKKVVR